MSLQGRRIAILAEDLYEDLELWYPYYRLKEEGADLTVVGTGRPSYVSKHNLEVNAEMPADAARADQFDAIVVPGGYAPDRLRRSSAVVSLVREAHEKGKVIAAICHAGWVLASADILRGRRVSLFYSIKDDMVNAGAQWQDQPVTRDGNIITSRTPDDLPDFCKTIISALSEKTESPLA